MINDTIKTIGKNALVVVLWMAGLLGAFWVGLQLYGNWNDEWSGYNASQYVSDGYCNIAVVPIVGEIVMSPDTYTDENSDGSIPLTTSMSDTMGLLGRAESDPNIRGVMALIDSPGGSPSGSKLISDGLKNSSMPTAAFILDVGASGGYQVASGANRIFAMPYSNVGSIGVTMSYLDYSKQNTEQGLEYVELASGKFKDSGDPDKPLSAEEKALFQRDLKIFHDTFVAEVATNRNLPVEDVAKLADGSTLPAPLALEKKLIDQIGGKEDVREWFAGELGMASEDIIFCQ